MQSGIVKSEQEIIPILWTWINKSGKKRFRLIENATRHKVFIVATFTVSSS